MVELEKYKGNLEELKSRRLSRSMYPWSKMEIGDCFVSSGKFIRQLSYQQSKRLGFSFSVKKQNDGRFLVIRIA